MVHSNSFILTAPGSCWVRRQQSEPYMTVLSSIFSCKSVVHADPITQLFPTTVVPISRAGEPCNVSRCFIGSQWL